jgi:DNA-binding beta-propeller fold protein YncE
MKSRKAVFTVVFGLVVAAMVVALPGVFGGCEKPVVPGVQAGVDSGKGYRSPYDVAFGGDGMLAVSDRTLGELVLIDTAGAKVAHRVTLKGEPTGVAWSADNKHVYVSQFGAGSVADVDAASAKVARTFAVGPYPAGLALAAKRGLLLVAESGNDRLAAIDLATGKTKATVPLTCDPQFLAVTPDESLAVVANLRPVGDATRGDHAAVVSLVDLEHFTARAIVLPSGGNNVRGVRVSPDGRWAYVVHTLGKFMLPTTQLDRGWVNTNAMSIIDLKAGTVYCTVLLDLLSEGACDPWGMAISKDGRTMWVTLAGAQQVAKVDLGRLHPLLEGKIPKAGAANLSPADQEFAKKLALLEPYKNSGVQNTWFDVAADPSKRALLANDLTALPVADVLTRVGLGQAQGPRGTDLSPDGSRLAVAAYYSGQVLLLDPATLAVAGRIDLGPSRAIDEARRGEMIFHDGTYCFQHWLSCSTCHPSARSDGNNWDLLNDGIGNPKNTKSMLYAHRTPPMMAQGVRADMSAAVAAGFKFILFRQPSDTDVSSVEAYLRTLTPLPSPHLVAGHLSEQARRGKAIFESNAVGCAKCHSGPLLTNLKLCDVGTRNPNDNSSEFVTSMLVEMWRTAPYLHDGSAATMRDVLTSRNAGDKHGVTSHLTSEQIDDLAEYLLSQ